MLGPTIREIREKRDELIKKWVTTSLNMNELVSALIECDDEDEQDLLSAISSRNDADIGSQLAKIIYEYAKRAVEPELQDWLERGFWDEQRASQEDEAYERWRDEAYECWRNEGSAS